MDRRRRFLPQADSLEGRQLLNATPVAASSTPPPAQTAKTTPAPSPQTAFAQSIAGTRQFHISQFPSYLKWAQTRRNTIPASVVAALQDDLRLVQNRLNKPPQSQIISFMVSLRNTLKMKTLSAEHAQVLSAQFGQILQGSGASPEVTAKFQKDMNNLVRTNINGPTPAIVSANDYAVIVQYILSVGRKVTSTADSPAPSGTNTASASPMYNGASSKGTPRY